MNEAIPLTEQQHQALESRQGRPVAVVDPVTNRTYVLIAAEAFERHRDLLEGSPATEPPTTAAPAVPSLPRRLKDLPTPPVVTERARQECAARGMRRRKWREWMEQELKLQYYFGGRYVGYLTTPDGLLIVAAGRLASEEFGRQLDAVDPAKRRDVILEIPPRWDETVSEILTPFSL